MGKGVCMKKICYVVTIPDTIVAFFIPQLRYLADSGYDVTVICSESDDLQNKLGNNIHFIPVNIPRGVSVYGSLKALYMLKRIFKDEKFDLIQYSTANAAFYASIAAKRVGCKVRNYHLMGLRYIGAKGIGRSFLKFIEKITCNNSTSIECVSKSNMEMGIKEGLYSPEKVTVVWNGSSGGVDCNRFDYKQRCKWRKEIREKLGYSNEDFIFGFVGRINKDKGIDELLEAYFSLETDAKLLLIGVMEGEKSLNKSFLRRARKCESVKFHDAVSDIEKYYAAIDVLVLPSYREGFGNVVIEAGAVGTPAIVSNIPGPIDTIDDGRTAITVKVKSAKDLSDKMLLIRTIDYQMMGFCATKFVKENFDSNKLCEKILERKQELLL